MYAIVDDSGCQLKVEEGQELDVDLRGQDVEPGQEIQFDRVLAVRNDSGLHLGHPVLEGARVTAEIVGKNPGPKLTIQKIRRRKTYRRKTGHRQWYHTVRITKIEGP